MEALKDRATQYLNGLISADEFWLQAIVNIQELTKADREDLATLFVACVMTKANEEGI